VKGGANFFCESSSGNKTRSKIRKASGLPPDKPSARHLSYKRQTHLRNAPFVSSLRQAPKDACRGPRSSAEESPAEGAGDVDLGMTAYGGGAAMRAQADTKSLRSPAGQTIGGTPELQKADPPSECALRGTRKGKSRSPAEESPAEGAGDGDLGMTAYGGGAAMRAQAEIRKASGLPPDKPSAGHLSYKRQTRLRKSRSLRRRRRIPRDPIRPLEDGRGVPSGSAIQRFQYSV